MSLHGDAGNLSPTQFPPLPHFASQGNTPGAGRPDVGQEKELFTGEKKKERKDETTKMIL